MFSVQVEAVAEGRCNGEFMDELMGALDEEGNLRGDFATADECSSK